MMDAKVVLCADSESLKNPQIVGLQGENLFSQEWLRVFCSAVEARNYLKSTSASQEVWVASTDDVDPLNLAAALKKDSKEKEIYVLASEETGSLKSRAHSAGITGMLTQQAFAQRYAFYKRGQRAVDEQISQVPSGHIPASGSLVPFPEARSRLESVLPSEKALVSSGKSAYVLSVVSASGGAGKSTVAALAALCSQARGNKTLLLDADLQFGDMQHFLGEKTPLTVDGLLGDPSQINRLSPSGAKPALLAPPVHLEESEVLGAKVSGLLETLKSNFDVIIVNTGSFWSDQQLSLIERSSATLFLIDQRPSSLRACKHALDLCARCGIAANPFLFGLNRCAKNAPLTSIDVSCALQGARVIELKEGGREVGELLGSGLPEGLLEDKNSLYQSIDQMLEKMLPQGPSGEATRESQEREKKGFWGSRKKRRVACL